MKIINKFLELLNIFFRIITLVFCGIALLKYIRIFIYNLSVVGTILSDITDFSGIITFSAILVSTYFFCRNKDSKKKNNILIFILGIIAIFLPIIIVRYVECDLYFMNRPYIEELTDPYAYFHIWPVVAMLISTIYSYFIYNKLNIKNKAK